MSLSDKIKKLKEDIQTLSIKLNETDKAGLKSLVKDLEKGKNDLKGWTELLEVTKDLTDEVSNSLSYVANSFAESAGELQKQNKALSDSKSIISSIASQASTLLSVRKGEQSINRKSVELAKEKLKEQTRSLKTNLAAIQNQAKDNELSEKKRKILRAQASEIQNVINNLGEYEEGLEGVLENDKKINKELGFAAGALSGLDKQAQKIGIPPLGISDAMDKTKKLGQEAAHAGKDFNAMGTFTKQIGKNLMGSLSPINLLLGFVMKIVNAFIGIDKAQGEFSKSLGVDIGQTRQISQELGNIARLSGDRVLNEKRLLETLGGVNAELGTSAMLSTEELKTMTKLNRQSGISLKDQAGLFKLSKATGKEYKDFVKSFQGSAKAAKFQKGVAINTKKLMLDMNNISNRTKISIEGGTDGLANAAVEAKILGGNLNDVAGIADKLLNFEESISNELEAELLLGKDINLEEARRLALNNDMAGVAREIKSQMGGIEDFSNLNRIQQEAIAKAMGMSADQMADMLVEQEALASLDKELDKNGKRAFEMAKEKYGVEEASRRLKEDGVESLLDEQSKQEELNDSMEKMNDVFVMMAPSIETIAHILLKVFDIIGSMMSSLQVVFNFFGQIGQGITKLFGPLGKLGKFLKGIAYLAVAYAAYKAYASLATIPIAGVPLGIAAAAAVTAAGFGLIGGIKTADDMVSPGGSGSGYGNRTLMGPEGAIQLNNKDTVIAGTNLFGDDVKSEPGKSTEMAGKGEIQVKGGGDMSAVISAINTLSGNLNAIASRPINVAIDGNKVITATTDQKPNETGDAIRKNSFEIQ